MIEYFLSITTKLSLLEGLVWRDKNMFQYGPQSEKIAPLAPLALEQGCQTQNNLRAAYRVIKDSGTQLKSETK